MDPELKQQIFSDNLPRMKNRLYKMLEFDVPFLALFEFELMHL